MDIKITGRDIDALYRQWKLEATEDIDVVNELQEMSDDELSVQDAFYKDLSFGTGGLRGIIGAGTNRMNIHTVRKASQGLSDYLNAAYARRGSEKDSKKAVTNSIVIARDSRIKSDVFARAAAGVFAENGIHVYYFEDIAPTPLLSFAVRELHAAAGVVITASHNPSQYNGYKVYGSDGCQITTEAAKDIQAYIQKVDPFCGVKYMSKDSAFVSGMLEIIDKTIIDRYESAVLEQSVLFGDKIDKNASIVYTPLNGTGLVFVMDVLKAAGYGNITVVSEQAQPNGDFPTCPKPNPEEREAMELGLQYCREYGADLLIATDPDADRCGIAVKASSHEGDDSGEYRLLSANETGILLLDYICSQRLKHDRMPQHPVFMKTIVTNDLAEKIASSYGGVETVNTLTGFKFIGEKIGELERKKRVSDFIFAFEESYGFLSGTYVRDKDGVNAAFLIAEMFCYYASQNISLLSRLEQLYEQIGFCLNTQHSYEFSGSSGMEQMNVIMEVFRGGLDEIAGRKICRKEDYGKGLNGLPKSNVLMFYFDNGSIVVRPSGTEPKLKVYISITAESRSTAGDIEESIAKELEEKIRAVAV